MLFLEFVAVHRCGIYYGCPSVKSHVLAVVVLLVDLEAHLLLDSTSAHSHDIQLYPTCMQYDCISCMFNSRLSSDTSALPAQCLPSILPPGYRLYLASLLLFVQHHSSTHKYHLKAVLLRMTVQTTQNLRFHIQTSIDQHQKLDHRHNVVCSVSPALS